MADPSTTPAPRADALTGWFAHQVADVGEFAMGRVLAIGDVSLFALRTFGWTFARWQRRDVLMPSLYQIGVMSLPVVALTGLFIGMVLAVQSYAQFKAIGLETRLGSVINLSLVRELGPVLAATMLAGRVGSAMAAELGTMRVTEQIDALECMGANPIGAAGLIRLIEAASQVMGKAGDMQIKGAKLALVQSGGGWANLRGVAVLGA
jgi:phospholipid/cholesterol/gamma-HCH transport system permease protein